MSAGDDERPCEKCGGPCKVPKWALDSSYFANDLFGFQAHLTRCHDWVTPERLAEVARIVAATRALPVVPTFPCVVCQKFAFERDGVTCYWCGRGIPAGVKVREVVAVGPVDPEPAPPEPAPVRAVKAKPAVDAPPSLFG